MNAAVQLNSNYREGNKVIEQQEKFETKTRYLLFPEEKRLNDDNFTRHV